MGGAYGEWTYREGLPRYIGRFLLMMLRFRLCGSRSHDDAIIENPSRLSRCNLNLSRSKQTRLAVNQAFGLSRHADGDGSVRTSGKLFPTPNEVLAAHLSEPELVTDAHQRGLGSLVPAEQQVVHVAHVHA